MSTARAISRPQNLSLKDQHQYRKDLDRLTRPNRIFSNVAGVALAGLVVLGLGIEAFRVSEPGSKADKLPNITTEQGLNAAQRGVKSGNLVEVEALADYQELQLNRTDLLVQPRDFSSIALDSTATLKDDSRGIEEGLLVHEAGPSQTAQPNTPYYVP